MKALLTLLLISTMFIPAWCQVYTNKINSSWGEPVKLGKYGMLDEIVGKDETGFYVTMFIRKGLKSTTELLHISNKLVIKNQQALEPSRDYKDFSISSVLFFDGNLYALGYNYEKKLNKKSLMAMPINKKTLLLDESHPITLAEIQYESRKNTGSIEYRISEDSKALAIRLEGPNVEGSKGSTLYKAFNSEFELLWEAEFENAVAGQEGLYISSYLFTVDNEGNIYEKGDLNMKINSIDELSTREYRKEVKAEGRAIQSYFSIYHKGATEPLRTELLVEDFDIKTYTFKPLASGNISFTGLYSDDEKAGANGVFYLEVDPIKGEIENINKEAFGKEFITQYWSHRHKKKAKKKEAKNAKKDKKPEPLVEYEYLVRDLLTKENGETVMLAEQYYVRVVTTTTTDANGNTTTRTTYYYYYKDIIATCYSTTGQVKWVKKIPKRQVSTNDGGRYSSYYAFTQNDNVYIVFNDNAENVNVDNAENAELEWFNWKNGVCALATISDDGEVEREWMFNLKDENVIAVPKVSGGLDDDTHLLFTQKKKKSTFVTFTVD